jgi:hypothetical protein
MSNKSIVLDYWWTRGTVWDCWRTRKIVRQEVQGRSSVGGRDQTYCEGGDRCYSRGIGRAV